MDKEKKSSLMLANIIGEIMLSKKANDVVSEHRSVIL